MRNINLRKRISRKNLKKIVPCQVNNSEFKSELLLLYRDFGHNAALINKAISFYEEVTYLAKDDHGISEKCSLHLGNVVTINVNDVNKGENYTMIRAIFSHKEDFGFRINSLDSASGLDPIQHRKADVHEDEVRL